MPIMCAGLCETGELMHFFSPAAFVLPMAACTARYIGLLKIHDDMPQRAKVHHLKSTLETAGRAGYKRQPVKDASFSVAGVKEEDALSPHPALRPLLAPACTPCSRLPFPQTRGISDLCSEHVTCSLIMHISCCRGNRDSNQIRWR